MTVRVVVNSRARPVMFSATALTLGRALAAIPISVAILVGQRDLAFALFAVAASTDLIDGWLARRLGTASPWGALIDPLADKALVVTTLAALTAVGTSPLWLVALVAGRETLVAALRTTAYLARTQHPATASGKAKTLAEMLGIAALFTLPTPLLGIALLATAAGLGIATLPLHVALARRRFT